MTGPVPAGGEELREAIAAWLCVYVGGVIDEERSAADAVLALPEVAALLDAAEMVRRVEALADGGLHDDILAGRVSINVIRKIHQAVDGQQ